MPADGRARVRQVSTRQADVILIAMDRRMTSWMTSETTQAALQMEDGLVIGVELRGLEPLTPTLPGRLDGVRRRPPESEKA